MKKGLIFGLIGFTGFIVQLLVVNFGEMLGLSQDAIVALTPWLVVLWIGLLWVGIMKTIRSKGEHFLLGLFLCLIAPIGWLIALFMKDRRPNEESWQTSVHRKYFWINVAVLAIGIALIVAGRPKPPSPEVIDNLRTTYRFLIEKGASVNTKRYFTVDDFVSLTGLDIGARLRAEGSAKMKHHDYGCLSLANTDISDDDLSRLQVLADLRQLDLSNTNISDAGISHLEGLKKLKRLLLQNTRVTVAGIKRLKAALPECLIN